MYLLEILFFASKSNLKTFSYLIQHLIEPHPSGKTFLCLPSHSSVTLFNTNRSSTTLDNPQDVKKTRLRHLSCSHAHHVDPINPKWTSSKPPPCPKYTSSTFRNCTKLQQKSIPNCVVFIAFSPIKRALKSTLSTLHFHRLHKYARVATLEEKKMQHFFPRRKISTLFGAYDS